MKKEGYGKASDVLLYSLFRQAPYLRDLFKGKNTQKTGILVLKGIEKVIDNISTPRQVIPYLNQLGSRHVKYGLKPQYFDIIQKAFIHMLKMILKTQYNDRIEEGFSLTLTFIKNQMVADNFKKDVVCDLCQRATPMFIFPNNNNQIENMSDKFLPPFLSKLK